MSEAAPQAARSGETTLGELTFHYGDAYRIRPDQRGHAAERRDGKGEPLVAATPGALWDLVALDYAFDPVPRDCDPPARDPLDVAPLRLGAAGRRS